MGPHGYSENACVRVFVCLALPGFFVFLSAKRSSSQTSSQVELRKACDACDARALLLLLELLRIFCSAFLLRRHEDPSETKQRTAESRELLGGEERRMDVLFPESNNLKLQYIDCLSCCFSTSLPNKIKPANPTNQQAALSSVMALLLDPDIRDWVVVPLFIIIVIAMLLRSTVMQYMQSAKQPIPIAAVRAHNLLRQATRIRGSAARYLHNGPARQQAAVELLQKAADELEHREKEEGGTAADPMEQMMQNPMGMLGGNMVFMVQNMVRSR